mmetsp:Transcript_37882/g.117781  ORF Transcript_37882/g.117781 Transcript_37882/m.117781 type:complete len:264 (-) Transcript_37882:442-1233(-)
MCTRCGSIFIALGSKTRSSPTTSPYMAMASCRVIRLGSMSSMAFPARAASTKALGVTLVTSRRQTGESVKRYVPMTVTAPLVPTSARRELPKDSMGLRWVARIRSEKSTATRPFGRPTMDILCAWPLQKLSGWPQVMAMSAPRTVPPRDAPRSQQAPWRSSSRQAMAILPLEVPATTGLNALPPFSVNCSGGERSAMPASRTLPTRTRPTFPAETSRNTIAILLESKTFTSMSAASVAPAVPSLSRRWGMNSGGARQFVPWPT